MRVGLDPSCQPPLPLDCYAGKGLNSIQQAPQHIKDVQMKASNAQRGQALRSTCPHVLAQLPSQLPECLATLTLCETSWTPATRCKQHLISTPFISA
jgi:hypothetical protein